METLSEQFHPIAKELCDRKGFRLLTREEHEKMIYCVVVGQWETSITFVPNWDEPKEKLPTYVVLCFMKKLNKKLFCVHANEIYIDITTKYEFCYKLTAYEYYEKKGSALQDSNLNLSQ